MPFSQPTTMITEKMQPPDFADLGINTNEEGRLQALNSYHILDTGTEKEFDRLVELAKIICNVPIAAITLIDVDRQWFKSKIGINLNETSREISFCNYAIQQNCLYEVEDATMDFRFKDNPLVKGYPQIRFYAGYPLIDPDGFAIGTLCVIDHRRKKLTEKEHRALKLLAKEVISQIVSKKDKIEKNHFEEMYLRSTDLLCMTGTDGFFKKVNPAFSAVLGWTDKELMEKPFLDFVHPDDKELTLKTIAEHSSGNSSINVCNRYLTKSGKYKVLSWICNPDFANGVIYAIAHDETEMLASQHQVVLAEKGFRDVFENSPDAIFVEDMAGNILDVNIAGVALQGASKEKLIGVNFRQLVPKEKFVKLLTDYKKLFLGISRTVESSVWSAAKGEIPVEVSGKKIVFDDKDVLLLLVRDVSERKKMEAERANAILEKIKLQEEQTRASLAAQEAERNRIATEMHDDVGAGLSRISILGQVIKTSINNPGIVASNIDKVLSSSKEVQENISEIIWAMNPKNDTFENLISYINYFAAEFLELSAIDFKIDLPKDISPIIINGKTRRNIFLIIKESLNNVVKYSEATSVTITIRINTELFSIIIRDNGVGFDAENTSRFSNGMQNMKQRTKEIHGIFKIISNRLTGTSVYLQVPIIPEMISY